MSCSFDLELAQDGIIIYSKNHHKLDQSPVDFIPFSDTFTI